MSERSPSNIRAITVTVLTIAMAVVSYWFVFTPNVKESTTYSYRGVEVQLPEPLIALNNIGLTEDPSATRQRPTITRIS